MIDSLRFDGLRPSTKSVLLFWRHGRYLTRAKTMITNSSYTWNDFSGALKCVLCPTTSVGICTCPSAIAYQREIIFFRKLIDSWFLDLTSTGQMCRLLSTANTVYQYAKRQERTAIWCVLFPRINHFSRYASIFSLSKMAREINVDQFHIRRTWLRQQDSLMGASSTTPWMYFSRTNFTRCSES